MKEKSTLKDVANNYLTHTESFNIQLNIVFFCLIILDKK